MDIVTIYGLIFTIGFWCGIQFTLGIEILKNKMEVCIK